MYDFYIHIFQLRSIQERNYELRHKSYALKFFKKSLNPPYKTNNIHSRKEVVCPHYSWQRPDTLNIRN